MVFSPTGQARIDLFYDGARHTVATTSYRGGPKKWFDVRLDNMGSDVSVWVDGALVFANVSTYPVPDGAAGLLTHWSPGRFDDVWWDNNPHPMFVAKFAEPVQEPFWQTQGTWDTSGGTLNSTAVGASDLALYQCACWSTGSIIRARLLNQFGAAGNLVGVVYNYADAVVAPDKPDYYEVVFSSTGIAQMNKVLNGVRTRVASSTHTVPKNTWFDVQIVRRGTTTTVKVNGTAIFENVQQRELGGGKVGLVTHYSKGRFDNVVVRDNPFR